MALSKGTIGTVVSGMIAVGSMTASYAIGNHKHYNVKQVKQKDTIQNKSIGIKTKQNKTQGRKMIVAATAYTNDPITATGTVPKEGRTIAVDPKVIPYGTKVYIPQFDKVFIAEDCGSAIKGNKIDIYMNSYNKCMEWGIRNIEIYVLD